MSNTRKFAALDDLRADAPPAVESPSRRGGRRSDPQWRLFALYLRRDTQRAARRKAEDEGASLSDVTQELLEKWLSKPANTGPRRKGKKMPERHEDAIPGPQPVEHAVTDETGQTVAVIISIGSSQDIVDAIDADQDDADPNDTE